MRLQPFSILTGTITASLLGSITLSATALSPLGERVLEEVSTTPAERMITELNESCDRVREVTYQSEALISPDGTTQAYAEGTLRKIKRPSSDRCLAAVNETVSLQILTDSQGKIQASASLSDLGAYITFHPRSFSPDNRFLVGDTEITPGRYTRSSIALVDLATGTFVKPIDLCEHSAASSFDHVYYSGFLSPTQVVVRCSQFDQPAGERIEWFEAINLLSGEAIALATEPTNLITYGTPEGDFEVTQTQIFP
ncbi:MAG: hypothetical protein AAFP03_07585 [Cyanobacteria bacterium J06598_3]